jgi:hypothetical protein
MNRQHRNMTESAATTSLYLVSKATLSEALPPVHLHDEDVRRKGNFAIDSFKLVYVPH